MKKRLIGLLMMSVLWTAACGAPTEVTYYQDVKPIIDAKCNSCHLAGGIAPFTLESYQQVIEVAAAVKLNVKAGIMPPWPPNNDCDDYVGDLSLTAKQIDTISAWVDQGTPEGDALNPGDPLPGVGNSGLSRVDETLSMPVEYTPPGTEPDDYRCFLVPWPASRIEPVYVTGYNLIPGNAKIVHHVIVFLADASLLAAYEKFDADDLGPGYTCFGGSGGKASSWLGAWAPGAGASAFPKGTGIRVDPGSFLIMQVHYNVLEAGAQPDRSQIELTVESSVANEAIVMPWTNFLWVQGTGMVIPAGEPDVVHSFPADSSESADPTLYMPVFTDRIPANTPINIYSSSLHMHNLGTRAVASIERKTGGSECLLDIPAWDFAWQGAYGHKAPKRFVPGDQLRIECHWDNTAANQPVYNGVQQEPRDVQWGEGTTDEMCLGVFFITAAP